MRDNFTRKGLIADVAKAVFVAHNDEDYAHVHIVASKIVGGGENPRLDGAGGQSRPRSRIKAMLLLG